MTSYMHDIVHIAYACKLMRLRGISGQNSLKGGRIQDFLKKGKIVISIKNKNFSRSWMTKRTSLLKLSREI